MNLRLPSLWDERIHNLALGLEPRDPMRRSRIGLPGVEVAVDGVPHPLPRTRRVPGASPWVPTDALRRIGRKDTCRYVLLWKPGAKPLVTLRFQDRGQRFAPRRLEVALPDPIEQGRVCRPALFPGAAYDVPAGAVGLRGRITRDGAPLRWARAEARRTEDDVPVGWAHGDQHGEFVLLLDPEAVMGAELVLPIRVRVVVSGPDDPLDPDDFPGSDVDPLWDLPVEKVPLGPAADGVLAGTELPDGYASRAGSDREVELGLDGLGREEFDFS